MAEFEIPAVALKALSFTGFDNLDDYADYWNEDLTNRLRDWDGEPADIRAAAVDHLTNRCCSVPDVAAAGGEIAFARWPDACAKELRIYVNWNGWNPRLMSMGVDDARQQFKRAMAAWTSSVDLVWTMTANKSQAHCEVDWARLSGNTLAWSHLANNSCRLRASQRYDHRRWTPHYFYLVVLHELGHLLGLPHQRGNYIMNPSIVTSLDGLTESDIQRARDLGYGKPDRRDPEPSPGRVTIPETPVMIDGQPAGVLKFEPTNTHTPTGGTWDV